MIGADAFKGRTKYVSLAFHNSEMVVVHDMGVFTSHFCYTKKQKHGAVMPVAEFAPGVDEGLVVMPEPGDTIILDDDDIE